MSPCQQSFFGTFIVSLRLPLRTLPTPHCGAMNSAVETVKAGAAEVARLATEHAEAHPYHAAFTGLSLGLAPAFGFGWMTAPILKVIGFGPLGPIAGEKTLCSQSKYEY